MQVIKVPDIGEGITQVELVAWHVKQGDTVAQDQALADVMTDKATVEIPSPVAGQVVGLGGAVGQVLAVGSELIRIERDGLPAAPPAREAGKGPPSSRPPLDAGVHGQGPGLRVGAKADKPIASPAVRARAWELGVDLNEVAPSGPGGRIVKADLDAYVARRGVREPPPAAAAREAPRPVGEATASGQAHEVRIVGVRRMIAQKMQESKRRIPHYTYVEEVDVTALQQLRAQINEQWGASRGRLTLLPFLIQAIVQALREFPQINARFDDEAGVLTRYDAVHVGIATQTDAGLMVPVLRDAQQRDLWSCAAEIARLAEAARSGRATREELTGSTITVTSLGPLGGIVSTPVINHPEVAIVGVNRIAERPVVVQGAVVARQMMNLSSSFDHRVIDGATAAEFVQRVRVGLERPATLLIR